MLFTMDGFEHVIDEIGGIQICVEHPIRDPGKIELPAGCTQADGATALGWVRSRKTQEYVDGHWRRMPGVSDLTRNQRQQDVILSMLDRVAQFDSPQDLTGFAASLGHAFTLDDQLGLADAVDLAWSHRQVRPAQVTRLTIPVTPYRTSGGAEVLLPAATFADVLAGAGQQ